MDSNPNMVLSLDGHAQGYGVHVHDHEEEFRVLENAMDDGSEMVHQQEYSLLEAAQHDEFILHSGLSHCSI